MKKILAILCGATMMFAACTPDTGESLPYPTFPESSEYEITSGTGKYLKFAAEADWTLEVDYQYAYVKDNMGNMLSKVSGKAGEKNEVFVGAYSSIENYDADVVFHVLMKMNGYTQTLATFTIKKIEYAVQEYDIVSGNLRQLKFRATQPWTVSLSAGASEYAYLKWGDEENDEISGTATGEEVTLRVYTYKNIKNYDADIVFSVYRKMGSADAQEWAKFTIKKIEKPASIELEGEYETVTFGKYTGMSEFSNAGEVYYVNYAHEWDPIDGATLINNVEGCEKITVHAYNEGRTLTNYTDRVVPQQNADGEEIESEPFWLNLWTTVLDNGTKKFKLTMDLAHESALWSWDENKKAYEAYVNFEDGNGNVLTSVYYTCTYNPNNTGGGDTSVDVTFVNESMAAAAEMTLTGSGSQYTLTLNTPMALDPSYASYCAIQVVNGGQAWMENQGEGVLSVNLLGNGAYHICPLDMSTFNPYAITVRNYTLTAYSSDFSKSYTINVVLNWVADSASVAPVSLMTNMASQVGVSLEGSGSSYTYTFLSPDAIYSAVDYGQYIGLKFNNATEVSINGNGILSLQKNEEGVYYVVTWDSAIDQSTFNPLALEQTNYIITAALADGTTCNVTVVLGWLTGNGNSGIGGMLPERR